jgi:hypothetical protein
VTMHGDSGHSPLTFACDFSDSGKKLQFIEVS